MAESISSTVMERIVHHLQLMRPLLPTYAHLLISAIFPIFIASHASLTRPSSAAKRVKKEKKDSEDSEIDGEEEPVQKIETLTPSDAVIFPILAGCTLAGLYFLLKWLQDPAWLNYILGLYFSQLGLFFAFKFLKDSFTVIRSFIFPTIYSSKGHLYRVSPKDHKYISPTGDERYSPMPGILSTLRLPNFLNKSLWSLRTLLYARKQLSIHLQDIFKLTTSISLLDILALLISLVVVAWHTFISKPWPLTNFLGFSFCYGALQYTTPTTAWTGTLILCALFVYDIYFVFFTPMMVTVATKLDVPIKLLFPRPDGCVYPIGADAESELMKEYVLCKAKKKTMAMLGLGDVVVPGMVMAFALRFDLFLFYLRRQGKGGEKVEFGSVTGGWGERFWTSTSTIASTSAPASPEDDGFTALTMTPAVSASSKLLSSLKARSFPKPYFTACVIGYLLGLVITVVVMQVWGHAQPALLYLVPGVLGCFWGLAVVKGEVGLLWRYSEGEEGGKSEERKDGKKDGVEKGDGKEGEEKKSIEANDEDENEVSTGEAKKEK